MSLLLTSAGKHGGSAAYVPVATAPDVLFGANLWAWYNPAGIVSSGVGTNVTQWYDGGAATSRALLASGAGILHTTINGLAACDFLPSSVQALTQAGGGTGLYNLGGQTLISVFGVAQYRNGSETYAGFAGYATTNTAAAYDTGGTWLGVQKNNTAHEVAPGGPAPAGTYAVTNGTIYRFATIRNGTTADLYVNGVLQVSTAYTGSPGGGGGGERLMVGSAPTPGGGSSGFQWDGKVGEIAIVVGVTPTANQIADHDLYQKNKFGL